MKPHKWAKEIKAWADGAEIECNFYGDEGWTPVDKEIAPVFAERHQYRIKPQPKEPQEDANNYKKWEKQVKHFLDGGKVKAISLGIEGLTGYVKHVAAFDDDRFIFEIVKEPQYLNVYGWLENQNIRFDKDFGPYVGKIKLEQDE